MDAGPSGHGRQTQAPKHPAAVAWEQGFYQSKAVRHHETSGPPTVEPSNDVDPRTSRNIRFESDESEDSSRRKADEDQTPVETTSHEPTSKRIKTKSESERKGSKTAVSRSQTRRPHSVSINHPTTISSSNPLMDGRQAHLMNLSPYPNRARMEEEIRMENDENPYLFSPGQPYNPPISLMPANAASTLSQPPQQSQDMRMHDEPPEQQQQIYPFPAPNLERGPIHSEDKVEVIDQEDHSSEHSYEDRSALPDSSNAPSGQSRQRKSTTTDCSTSPAAPEQHNVAGMHDVDRKGKQKARATSPETRDVEMPSLESNSTLSNHSDTNISLSLPKLSQLDQSSTSATVPNPPEHGAATMPGLESESASASALPGNIRRTIVDFPSSASASSGRKITPERTADTKNTTTPREPPPQLPSLPMSREAESSPSILYGSRIPSTTSFPAELSPSHRSSTPATVSNRSPFNEDKIATPTNISTGPPSTRQTGQRTIVPSTVSDPAPPVSINHGGADVPIPHRSANTDIAPPSGGRPSQLLQARFRRKYIYISWRKSNPPGLEQRNTIAIRDTVHITAFVIRSFASQPVVVLRHASTRAGNACAI
ncbi:hypothetical protein OF83DRAFT_1177372 [Amylostereum chailletii]|nr:hypothetical protein OF83DRAFT_1177372 [Amylostereum chailletii]